MVVRRTRREAFTTFHAPVPFPAVSHRHHEQCAISILGAASNDEEESLLTEEVSSYKTPILLRAEVPSRTPCSGARSAALPEPTCGRAAFVLCVRVCPEGEGRGRGGGA